MAQYEQEPSGWAMGGAVFAGVMLIMIGIFQSVAGISAISKDDFYVATRDYVFDINVNGWGWIHLVLGIVVVLAGFALLTGKVWGGMVAIAVATLSAIGNFFLIPYYPWWSLLIIALDLWVIWAVTRPSVYRTP